MYGMIRYKVRRIKCKVMEQAMEETGPKTSDAAKTSRRKWIVLGIVLGGLLAVTAVRLAFAAYWAVSIKAQIRETQRVLLEDVDHAAVRDAALEFAGKHAKGEFPGTDERLPETIRALKPKSVLVRDGIVRIELRSKVRHQGLLVAAGGRTPPDPAEYETPQVRRKLEEGIWYYEDK